MSFASVAGRLPNWKNPFRGLGTKLAYIIFGAAVAVAVTVVAGGGSTTEPQNESCDLTQAIEQVVNMHLTMIRDTLVNPAKYFTPGGPESCVSDVMLKNFDVTKWTSFFSSVWDFALNEITKEVDNLIKGAVQKACNAINGAVEDTVGKINGVVDKLNNAPDNLFKGLFGSTATIPNQSSYQGAGGTYPPPNVTLPTWGTPAVTATPPNTSESGNSNNSGNSTYSGPTQQPQSGTYGGNSSGTNGPVSSSPPVPYQPAQQSSAPQAQTTESSNSGGSPWGNIFKK